MLTKKHQLQILGITSMIIAALMLLIWFGSKLFATQVADEHVVVDGKTFHATNAQMASFKIATVGTASFSTQESTDGKIALNADVTTNVFSPYSGRIVRLLAKVGDHVKQGQPLLTMIASEFNDSENELRNAQAQYEQAKTSEARKHAMYEARGSSMQDWQQAQTGLATASNALQAARNHLHVLGKDDADIEHILQSQGIDAVTYITAPIDGVVTDRQVGPGQNIQANSAVPVYAISDLSSVWLMANVREVDAPELKLGQKVEVGVLALPGKKFTSTLSFIGNSVDPVTRRVPVRAILKNSAGLLKPEMFADCDIFSSEVAAVLAVPAEAIIYEGENRRVWVVQNQHDIVQREIHTGRRNNGLVEVLDGLKRGERVVTSGNLFVDHAARAD